MRELTPILFLHIPKSAGTSVTEALGRNFSVGESCRLSSRRTFEVDLPTALKKNRFVSGHIPYSLVKKHLANAYCFTILRSPIARVTSLYKFWRSFDQNEFKGQEEAANVMHAKRTSIEDFVACRHPLVQEEVSNGMCKMLSSTADMYNRTSCDSMLYEDAKRNLDSLHFGTTEEIEKSFQILEMDTGLNLLNDVHLNVFRIGKDDTRSTDEIQAILEYNRADSQLFTYATESLRRRYEDQHVETQVALHGRTVLSPLRQLDGGRFAWDATQRLCGANWHEHETWNSQVPYRFSAGKGESTIYFDRPIDEACVVRIHILFFAQDQFCEPLQSIKLKIDNLEVPFVASLAEGGGALIQAELPSRHGHSSKTLKLSLASTYGFVPRLALAGSDDRRSLFAAVTSIDFSGR